MKKILISLLICLALSFIVFQVLQLEMYAYAVRTLIMVALTGLYFVLVKKRKPLFLLFLSMIALAELINMIGLLGWSYFEWEDNSLIYFIGNGLNMLAYVFLTLNILRTINVKSVFRQFPFHLIILGVLDVFCVYSVTGTTKDSLDTSSYLLEMTYNSVIMILLSVSLINFIYRDDKKSMNLLLGSIFIVFAEIIQLAYFYVANDYNALNVLCSLFLMLALLFYIIQSRMEYEEIQEFRESEALEHPKF
ncbi:hypothetical protein [Aegicerativicinus sediminis]|uniref:hypothetical protein n=1 Tax=Aegicerativicinus sediminis TaxID=2893202 RepID=UPI001E5F63B0|nr:hypothetical protein [Aegicerativicinus sediminis]